MKLLFVCNNLHIGGIQKALINLLKEISDTYDVTLFLFYPGGELSERIPKNVKIIPGNRLIRIMGMSQGEANKNGVICSLWRGFWAVITKLFGIGTSFGILTRLQKIRKSFDVAISFSQNSDFKMFYGGCNEFVINSVNAKKKITFVHCDFKNYFGNNSYNRTYYGNFDRIACVSDSCRGVFCEVCKGMVQKTFSVHNCCDFEGLERQSKEYKADYTDGAVNIFTAARISEEKGIFRMLPILSELKNQGFDFVWRIAGGGPLMERAKAECEKRALSDNVIFLGVLKNPYPYFFVSDLLLVPSYDEAAPMVFSEAQFFGLPILTTNTTSAKELVENTDAGFVCENNDEDIKKTLINILENPEIFLQKKGNKHVDNKKALCEFENLIM